MIAQSFTSSFHVYVHPSQGDDVRAAALNPKGLPSSSTGSRPLQDHPASPTIQGRLKHAPYAFRTIKAAVDYIEAWPKKDPNTGRSLPYLNDTISPQGSVEFVVIHLAPGMYGPRLSSVPPHTEDYHQPNGQPWNGEVFPIELPPRVCLQGASALDTILDARGYVHADFQNKSILSLGERVRVPGAIVPAAAAGYALSFIDSLTIRGTWWTEPAQPPVGIQAAPNGENGVAIAVRGPLGIAPTISNCIIVGNQIGLGLFDPDASLNAGNHHAPRVINNTFVWNHIGLYSRWQQGSIGTSRPLILNNIFDPVLHPHPPGYFPLPGWALQLYSAIDPVNSCFEGIDPSDLVAVVPGCFDPVTGQVPLIRSFNAYLPQHANIGNRSMQFQVGTRSASSTVPTPVVDLAVAGICLNGFLDASRADFYVRDVLAATTPPLVSRHDFRLAPMVRSMSQSTTFRNPCINMGISLRGGPIEFHQFNQIGAPTVVTIASPPGAPDDDLAHFHCFDWDCEGVGNSRDAPRTLEPNNPAVRFPEPFACAGHVDLGADEVGELIVSGYLDESRTFSRPHVELVTSTGRAPHTLQFANANTLFFLNMTDLSGTPALYVAPQFNLRHDSQAITTPTTNAVAPPGGTGEPIGAEWFAQLGPTHNPFVVPGVDPPLPFAHTSGQHQAFTLATEKSMRFELVRTGPIATHYQAFTRSRVADIGRHVMEDMFLNANVNARDVDYAEYDFLCPGLQLPDRQHDIFQANPWFDMGDLSSDPGTNDNQFLYPHAPSGRRLRHGTLNPPLTMFEDPIQIPGSGMVESFLFRNAAHPLFFWNNPNFTYAVSGLWGISSGDPAWFAAIFGMAPDRGWYAVRVNIELFDPDNVDWNAFGDPVNNLQTFLVVEGWPPVSWTGTPPGGTTNSVQADGGNTTQRRSALRERAELLRRRR